MPEWLHDLIFEPNPWLVAAVTVCGTLGARFIWPRIQRRRQDLIRRSSIEYRQRVTRLIESKELRNLCGLDAVRDAAVSSGFFAAGMVVLFNADRSTWGIALGLYFLYEANSFANRSRRSWIVTKDAIDAVHAKEATHGEADNAREGQN